MGKISITINNFPFHTMLLKSFRQQIIYQYTGKASKNVLNVLKQKVVQMQRQTLLNIHTLFLKKVPDSVNIYLYI